jgi:hypothetical protein
LEAPDKNDHKKFDSTFLGFLGKCFNFGGKYHISGKFLGVSGKFFSYLGKIGVCREKIFDSQNGTLTENVFGDGGGGGRRSGAKGGQKWPIDPPAPSGCVTPLSTNRRQLANQLGTSSANPVDKLLEQHCYNCTSLLQVDTTF